MGQCYERRCPTFPQAKGLSNARGGTNQHHFGPIIVRTAWGGVMGGYAISGSSARACNCIGPQNGDPVCPCMMPAYRERELGKKALEICRRLGLPLDGKPATTSGES